MLLHQLLQYFDLLTKQLCSSTSIESYVAVNNNIQRKKISKNVFHIHDLVKITSRLYHKRIKVMRKNMIYDISSTFKLSNYQFVYNLFSTYEGYLKWKRYKVYNYKQFRSIS